MEVTPPPPALPPSYQALYFVSTLLTAALVHTVGGAFRWVSMLPLLFVFYVVKGMRLANLISPSLASGPTGAHATLAPPTRCR